MCLLAFGGEHIELVFNLLFHGDGRWCHTCFPSPYFASTWQGFVLFDRHSAVKSGAIINFPLDRVNISMLS